MAPRRVLPLLFALLILAGACAAGGDPEVDTAGAPVGADEADAGPSGSGLSTPADDEPPTETSRDDTTGDDGGGALAAVLPDLELELVATGEAVPVRSLVDGDRPLLVWFWAPHCPRCNREIPDLDAFAAATPGLQVLGLGTQDSADEARDFMERHGVEAVELLWDDGYASWQHFDVQVQPYGILYSPAGVELARWPGEVDLDELADALG